jgi:hypothetical protein
MPARSRLLRILRPALPTALIVLSFTTIARAQTPELASFFEMDPAVALHGFALLSGAIVLLFEAYRSRP